MTENKQWLSHIQNSIPENVRGYSLSSYCLVLEAWRRGITVTYLNKNRRKSELYYVLSYQGKEHLFTVAKGDQVTAEALKICKSKHLTKKYLSRANVPVPGGNVFNDVNDNDIIEYADSLEYPLVLKPSNGTAGAGVIANIKNRTEFKEALNYVKYELKYKSLIVERFIEGEDYRIYVVGDKVIAGIKRLPANVIGDGKLSIKKLLENKQAKRDKNPSLLGRPIKIDKELRNMLKRKGYTMDSIPEKGERVFLKSKNNVSAGGDSIDVTDELTDEIKEIAINATNAIPGLAQCGVDLMVNKEKNTGAVIELNSMPHITAQLFPAEGKARDIPKAIIDYYFPETESNYSHPTYYFDFESIWTSFKDGKVKKFVLPSFPQGNLVATRFIVSGIVQRVNYGAWVRRQARDLNLNGYIKHLENGDASIIVSGSTNSIHKFRDIIQKQSSKKANVTKIVEKSRESPVKVGFEIMNPELDKKLKDGYYPVRVKGVKSNIKSSNKIATKKNTKKNNKKVTNSKIRSKKYKPTKINSNKNTKVKTSDNNDYYKKEYEKIINSTSWKITKPLRKIGSFRKRS